MKNLIFSFENNQKVKYKVYYGKPSFRYKRKGKIKQTRVLGLCDHPENKNPKIIIDDGAGPKRELSTVVEEIFHAYFWDKLEKDVRPFCGTVAKMLYKQGWRKTKN